MNATIENKLEVANEIARQIGARAFVMMGTRNKLGDSKALIFDVRGSRAFNKVKVTMEVTDTYTVEFFKCRKFDVVRHVSVEGIYADGLCQTIEHHTGLCLSL